jgi:hypothetical protein
VQPTFVAATVLGSVILLIHKGKPSSGYNVPIFVGEPTVGNEKVTPVGAVVATSNKEGIALIGGTTGTSSRHPGWETLVGTIRDLQDKNGLFYHNIAM